MVLPTNRGDREQQKFFSDADGFVNVRTVVGTPLGFGSFFVNETFGSQLAAAGDVSGTPEKIHNGTDNVLWTGTALSGMWVFDSTTQAKTGTKSVDATGALKNRVAQFERSSSFDVVSHISVTGWIWITKWDFVSVGQPPIDEVLLQFRLAGVNVGVSLNISAFIRVELHGTWQKFSIPLADFALATTVVDQLTFTQQETPKYFLDDIQIEESGGPLIYQMLTLPNALHRISEFNVFMAGPADTTLLNASMPNVVWNEFCGKSELETGVVLRERLPSGDFVNQGVLRSHADWMALPNLKYTTGGNDTSLWLSYDYTFLTTPVIDTKQNEALQVVISDDLSSLHTFRITMRGTFEFV